MLFFCIGCFFCFFFKQKTAYEVRISDWSSDVCSSDLRPVGDFHAAVLHLADTIGGIDPRAAFAERFGRDHALGDRMRRHVALHRVRAALRQTDRSEEHTSELPSLMRSSYAVFCLKKKKR